jgi:hypothetical protein
LYNARVSEIIPKGSGSTSTTIQLRWKLQNNKRNK